LLTLLIVAFIWSNSCLSREESGAQSGRITAFLLGILDPNGRIPVENFHHFVRKMAHFTEFAALGACLSWRFGMLEKRKRSALLLGFGAACVDETIQLFVPDRGPGIMDVAIDTCGVAAGMILLLLAHNFTKQFKPSKENKTL
jgi:VanZ family protein